MKKLQFVLIAIITTSFFISCQNSKNITKAEDFGPYAFNILKNLDNTSKEDFLNSLFTFEEIKTFAKRHKDSIPKKALDKLDELKKEEYEKRIGGEYDKLKAKGEKYNITWSDIEYSGYKYDERTEGGLTGIRGKLSFKHKDTLYIVRASALRDGESYIPLIIRRLSK